MDVRIVSSRRIAAKQRLGDNHRFDVARLLAAGVALLFVVGPAQAQTFATVSGVVRAEPTGEELAEVNVYIRETGQGSATDLTGLFRIERIEPGTYTIVASRVGYRTAHQQITLTAGRNASVEIFIASEPIELDEMLAQADRSFSAASSRVVREFDLAVRPSRSAQDLLQITPGLITAQHAGGGKAEQIFLRGFDADHGTDVNISIDGIPVNIVSHGHGQGYADLHFVIPEVVQSLTVHKGPYSAAYGNFSTAGAIEFATKDHLGQNLVRIEGGSYNACRRIWNHRPLRKHRRPRRRNDEPPGHQCAVRSE